MKRAIVGFATTMLVFGGLGLAGLGLASGTAQAEPGFARCITGAPATVGIPNGVTTGTRELATTITTAISTARTIAVTRDFFLKIAAMFRVIIGAPGNSGARNGASTSTGMLATTITTAMATATTTTTISGRRPASLIGGRW